MTDTDTESISAWVNLIRQGDEHAAQLLWDEFFPSLMRIAGDKLRDHKRRIADEEDVVLSAMKSFFRAAREGRFGDLIDRDDLCRLLSEMTRRKAVDLVRFNHRQKRDGVGESALGECDGENAVPMINEIPGTDPAPDLAFTLSESCGDLLKPLSADLRKIALLKLEGYTNEEIACRLGRSIATVERRLKLIRQIWRERLDE